MLFKKANKMPILLNGNIEKGKHGEKLAIQFLKKNGYKIIEKNYKTKIGEIDIIAKEGFYTVFIEVKWRKSALYGQPSEAVDLNKQFKYNKMAKIYMMKNNLLNSLVRFDVVDIIDDKVSLFADAFFVKD